MAHYAAHQDVCLIVLIRAAARLVSASDFFESSEASAVSTLDEGRMETLALVLSPDCIPVSSLPKSVAGKFISKPTVQKPETF